MSSIALQHRSPRRYLYEQLVPWARATLGLESALMTGAGRNQSTLPKLQKDLASILTTFAPRAQSLLAAAVGSVAGKSEERVVASRFQPGGTHALAGEFAGIDDFEVVAFLVVVGDSDPADPARALGVSEPTVRSYLDLSRWWIA